MVMGSGPVVDVLKFESPVVSRYTDVPGAALTLTDCSDTVKWLVRADAGGTASARLDARFGSSRLAPGGALVLGSRPGEWIVLGTADEVAEVIDALDSAGAAGGVGDGSGASGMADGANGSLDEPDPGDLVTALDWTHGRAMFRVTGHDAPRMLEKVCNLDWSDPMTPDGAVASASVAKVTCDIARNDVAGVPSYLILCDRSFGQYLFDALIDAGNEFDLGVASPAR